jgi:hypothetical protein
MFYYIMIFLGIIIVVLLYKNGCMCLKQHSNYNNLDWSTYMAPAPEIESMYKSNKSNKLNDNNIDNNINNINIDSKMNIEKFKKHSGEKYCCTPSEKTGMQGRGFTDRCGFDSNFDRTPVVNPLEHIMNTSSSQSPTISEGNKNWFLSYTPEMQCRDIIKSTDDVKNTGHLKTIFEKILGSRMYTWIGLVNMVGCDNAQTIMPMTYILPQDYEKWKMECGKTNNNNNADELLNLDKTSYLFVKNGQYTISSNIEYIYKLAATSALTNNNTLIQKYSPAAALLRGHRFNLKMYYLIVIGGKDECDGGICVDEVKIECVNCNLRKKSTSECNSCGLAVDKCDCFCDCKPVKNNSSNGENIRLFIYNDGNVYYTSRPYVRNNKCLNMNANSQITRECETIPTLSGSKDLYDRGFPSTIKELEREVYPKWKWNYLWKKNAPENMINIVNSVKKLLGEQANNSDKADYCLVAAHYMVNEINGEWNNEDNKNVNTRKKEGELFGETKMSDNYDTEPQFTCQLLKFDVHPNLNIGQDDDDTKMRKKIKQDTLQLFGKCKLTKFNGWRQLFV